MDSIKNKLFDYEVNPPAGSWDKIAAVLDTESLTDRYPAILHEMEVNPAPHNWEKINQALQGETIEKTETVIPKTRRSIPIWRYAAAAAILAAISITLLKWGGSQSKPENLEALKTVEQLPSDLAKNSTPAIVQSPEPVAVNPVPAESEVPKKLIAQNNRTNKTVQPTDNNKQRSISTALYTYEDVVPSVADRYVMLLTPDGNFIRMSKKWSNMICCVSGEEQDEDCKDQLKKWQEKLAQSSMTSGNFMDILDLVSSLNESSEL